MAKAKCNKCGTKTELSRCPKCRKPTCGDCAFKQGDEEYCHSCGQEIYWGVIEGIKDKYDARIRAVLERLRAAFAEVGLVVDEITFMDGDDYRWGFSIYTDASKNRDTSVQCTLQIAESLAYEDSYAGATFRIDFVQWGGRIFGSFSPFNYSPQCWVDVNDEAAIEARFTLFERIDVSDFAWDIKEEMKKG
jgi:hypothetical protein